MLLGDHLDFAQKEIRNVLAQSLTADPATPQEGQFWWRSDLNLLSIYDGATIQRFRFAVAITSADIQDGTIVATDISATAGIAMAQLAIDPTARANHTGTQLAATISNFTTAVQAINVNTLAAPTGDLAMNTHKITGLADGTANTDAASWGQVQSLVQGLAFKDSVRVATTANITLSGTQTIDGIAVVAGDRVLVKNQTTGSQNGIYVVAAGAWTRAPDADSDPDLDQAAVFVEEGTTLHDTLWVQTVDNVTVGTTALTWVQFNAAGDLTAGAGLTRTGNSFSVNVDNSTIEINANNLRVKPLGITAAQIANATITDVQVAAANKDGAVGTPSMRTLGRGAAQALPGTAVAAGANGLWAQFDASGNLQAVTAPVIGVGAPVGTIHEWPGDTAPPGFFLCDGSAISRTSYPDLFSVLTFPVVGNTTNLSNVVSNVSAATIARLRVGMPISGPGFGIPANTTIASVGTTSFTLSNNATATATGASLVVAPYGVGDGTTTFNVPDFRGRSPIGQGQGATLTNRVLGAAGGEEAHVLTVAEMPSHQHGIVTRSATIDTTTTLISAAADNNDGPLNAYSGRSTPRGQTANTDPAGGSGAHNNMSPFLTVNYIIQSVPGAGATGGATGALKFAQSIGDGLATSFTVAHGLGTTDVHVTVKETAAPFNQIFTTTEVTDINSVTVRFSTPPSANQYRVVVLG